jgi:hypothetical protein
MGDADAEHEMHDLNKVGTECEEWILTAKLLLVELQTETQKAALCTQESKASVEQLEKVLSEKPEDEESANNAEATPAPDSAAKKTGEECEYIGYDQNTHKKGLPQEKEAPPPETVMEGGIQKPTTPDTQRAYEALGEFHEQAEDE